MKTSHTLMMAGLCLAVTATQQTFSQSSNSLRFKVPAQSVMEHSDVANPEDPIAAPGASMNSKAVAHFHQTYTDASEEKWMATPDGSRVRFISNGMRTIESYNKHGQWVGTIRYLPLNQVPADVARDVANAYPRYKIFFAENVKTHDGTVNIVKIETATNWKMLRVSEGTMEVMEDLDK